MKTSSMQAFWIVSRREGRAFGSVRSTLWMLAWPSPGVSIVTSKVTPLALLPWPPTVAVIFGANGRLAQLAALNGAEIGWTPPS